MKTRKYGVSIMSPFATALHHYASQPNGLQRLQCLRLALSTHQRLTVAASGVPDLRVDEEIREIDDLCVSVFSSAAIS